MRAAAFLAATLALFVAGCDGGGASREQRREIKIANPYHDRLEALSPFMQRLTLMRAIRDNGNRCQRVEAGRYQEDYRNMAMWVALCNDARHWSVFIAPNGDTQVRQCTQMRQLELPACRPVSGPGAPPPPGNTAATTNSAG